MSANMFSETLILNELDTHAKQFDFPVLDNANWCVGDVRLSAFAGQDWLLVFEILVFNFRSFEFVNTVYAYGSNLVHSGYQTSLRLLDISEDSPFEDELGNDILDIEDFTLVINGENKRFSPSKSDFESLGLPMNLLMQPTERMFRYVCAVMHPRFFLSVSELCKLLGSSEIPLILQLTQWSHPDIAAGELPSQNECMKQIARAIQMRDSGKYSCPPTSMNTHWANWLHATS